MQLLPDYAGCQFIFFLFIEWLVHFDPSVFSPCSQHSSGYFQLSLVKTGLGWKYLDNIFANSDGAAAGWILNDGPSCCSSLPPVILNEKVKCDEQTSRPGSVGVIMCPPCTSCDRLTTECGCFYQFKRKSVSIGVQWVLLSKCLWWKNEIFGVGTRQHEWPDRYSHICNIIILQPYNAGDHYPNIDLLMWFIRLRYCSKLICSSLYVL